MNDFFINFTLIIHFLWIVFVIIGGLLVLKWPRLFWFHGGALCFSLILNVFGLYCPLTYLENYLYTLSGKGPLYDDSFLIHYINALIYPNLNQDFLRTGEIIFVLIYAIFYLWLYLKTRRYITDT